jgi:polyamine oxidase
LCIDQRGFKTIIQQEAKEFLDSDRVMLNSTVENISYSPYGGVEVTLTDGSTRLSADYAIVTFSLGVLQNDDVRFEPDLPMWKVEGIHSMKMVGHFIAARMFFLQRYFFPHSTFIISLTLF